MKISKVEIINYKSIKKISIPFEEYGSRSNKSKTTFLVGLNETGKSALLEALSYIDSDLEIDYENECFKPALDKNDYVELYIFFNIEKSTYWDKKLSEKCKIPLELAKKISFVNVIKNIWNKEDDVNSNYEVEIVDIDLHEYLLENDVIYSIKDKNSIKGKITKRNADSFLTGNQKILTKSKIEEIISLEMISVFNVNIPSVQIWKPEKQYLINASIDLTSFMDNPSLSIPLKNIFHLGGYNTDKDIKQVIERALKKQEKCDELKDTLSLAVTKHINKIWKEHKIKVVISINGSNCQVFIEDKDKKHNYFKMNQRSEGFKQFVSLILSLSALNESQQLRNKIILIDEPEVHLHPSGVRFMRDEILKIGKKNHVFVSTHSHYMVDTKCPDRHWIVGKEKAETYVNQIDENTSIEDDDVLLSAFGLNLFKELLPQNILVVEGGDDKQICNHCLSLLASNTSYSIKSSGGASKAPGIASLLVNENVPAFILFDDDKEGRDNKKRILDKFKESYSRKTVFTLRDLLPDLPKDSTIEDLMPLTFIKKFFETELQTQFNINHENAVIIQLKQQENRLKDKQKLDSLKMKLAKNFIDKYNTKAKISKSAPRFSKLIEAIIFKWE